MIRFKTLAVAAVVLFSVPGVAIAAQAAAACCGLPCCPSCPWC